MAWCTATISIYRRCGAFQPDISSLPKCPSRAGSAFPHLSTFVQQQQCLCLLGTDRSQSLDKHCWWNSNEEEIVIQTINDRSLISVIGELTPAWEGSLIWKGHPFLKITASLCPQDCFNRGLKNVQIEAEMLWTGCDTTKAGLSVNLPQFTTMLLWTAVNSHLQGFLSWVIDSLSVAFLYNLSDSDWNSAENSRYILEKERVDSIRRLRWSVRAFWLFQHWLFLRRAWKSHFTEVRYADRGSITLYI